MFVFRPSYKKNRWMDGWINKQRNKLNIENINRKKFALKKNVHVKLFKMCGNSKTQLRNRIRGQYIHSHVVFC